MLTERQRQANLRQLIKKIEDGPAVKRIEGGRALVELESLLSAAERCYVTMVLRLLLPKHELRAYWRQVRLGEIEVLKAGAKRARKYPVDEAVKRLMGDGDSYETAVAKVRRAGISSVPAADWADRVAELLGFPSAEAMAQFLKRVRKERRR